MKGGREGSRARGGAGLVMWAGPWERIRVKVSAREPSGGLYGGGSAHVGAGIFEAWVPGGGRIWGLRGEPGMEVKVAKYQGRDRGPGGGASGEKTGSPGGAVLEKTRGEGMGDPEAWTLWGVGYQEE